MSHPLQAVSKVAAAWVVVLISGANASTDSLGQPLPAPAGALVGTWRLVEHSNWDASGALVPQFGPHPIGYFVHDGTGHFSVHIMRTPPVRPFAAGVEGATVGELRELLQGYYAAFGTYTVDAARSEGVYRVEGSTLPEIIGTDVRLPYRIEGDSLIIGDGKTRRRVWERVK